MSAPPGARLRTSRIGGATSELDDRVLKQVLALNELWVPHVGALDDAKLASLLAESELALAVWDTGESSAGDLDPASVNGASELAGFVIAMGPGADYSSPNYRYFSARHETFTYVDRIAVSPRSQGTGVGRLLYGAVFAHGAERGSPVVCAEVNVDPPNPESLAFHQRMGFVEVGSQWTYDHTVKVALLEHSLDGTPPMPDRAWVGELLGRTPTAEFEVVVRKPGGQPVVIRNAPFMDDLTPMPTLYYLVDPDLSRRIGRLEAAGGVKEAEAEIGLDAIGESHARYQSERDGTVDSDHSGPRPSGGVGGTRRGVKCLHAHYAYYLAGGDDPVGRWVHDRLVGSL